MGGVYVITIVRSWSKLFMFFTRHFIHTDDVHYQLLGRSQHPRMNTNSCAGTQITTANEQMETKTVLLTDSGLCG